MWGISCLAENRLASKGLCSMKWVTGFLERNTITPRQKCHEQFRCSWTGKGGRLYSPCLVTSMLAALKTSMTVTLTPCGVPSPVSAFNYKANPMPERSVYGPIHEPKTPRIQSRTGAQLTKTFCLYRHNTVKACLIIQTTAHFQPHHVRRQPWRRHM